MKITIDLDKLETFDSFKQRYVLQNGKPITKQCLNNWIKRGVVEVKEFPELNLKLLRK